MENDILEILLEEMNKSVISAKINDRAFNEHVDVTRSGLYF